MKKVDALIVGAGPTGLTLGISLLKQGKSVLIAEKHPSGLDFSRAILINSDTLDALAPFGLNSALQEAGQLVDGFTMHVNGRAISQALFSVDNLQGDHPVCLPQLTTEKILQDYFLASGGEMLRGYEFSAQQCQFDAQPIRTTLRSSAGDVSPMEIESQWLFGCDGFHSSVRAMLDIGYPGSTLAARPYALDVTLADWPFETNVNVFLDRQGGCLVVQIGPDQVRIVTTTEAQRDAFLSAWPVKEVTWDTTFEMHFHVADQYGQGHVWLAGDAAHVHSPIGGRGMNMGILDAVTLAKAVATDNLRAYEQERKAEADDWVKFNERVSRAVMDASTQGKIKRAAATRLLPLVADLIGPRLARTAFNHLSSSHLKLKSKASG